MKPSANVIKVTTGYKPRVWQALAHKSVKRHNILVFHRRGGKSVFAVNHIINKALKFKKTDEHGRPLRNPQYAYVATTFGQVEKIVWQYFKDFLKDIPDVKFNETKLRIQIPLDDVRGTATIYLFGTEKFDSFRGMYLDGYVLDEYGDMHPDVRDKVFLPMLSDRVGWEMVIGTPKGENAFKDLFDVAQEDKENWYSLLMDAETSGILPESELNMLKRTMSKEAFRQEYMCDWNAAPSGKVYQTYIDEAKKEGRVTKVPYDPSVPVMTFWDLGMSDSMVVWFIQEVGKAIHVIDHIEDHGKGLPHYFGLLEGKKYRYGTVFLPHDAAQRSIETGLSRWEFFVENGFPDVVVCKRPSNIQDGIHAARMLIPRMWFNQETTALGVKALSSYEYVYDTKREVYSTTPLHNWASHSSDGIRLFAENYTAGMSRYMSFNGYSGDRETLQETAHPTYDIFEGF